MNTRRDIIKMIGFGTAALIATPLYGSYDISVTRTIPEPITEKLVLGNNHSFYKAICKIIIKDSNGSDIPSIAQYYSLIDYEYSSKNEPYIYDNKLWLNPDMSYSEKQLRQLYDNAKVNIKQAMSVQSSNMYKYADAISLGHFMKQGVARIDEIVAIFNSMSVNYQVIACKQVSTNKLAKLIEDKRFRPFAENLMETIFGP